MTSAGMMVGLILITTPLPYIHTYHITVPSGTSNDINSNAVHLGPHDGSSSICKSPHMYTTYEVQYKKSLVRSGLSGWPPLRPI